MKNKLYTCSACGLSYEDENWAKKCFEWCTKNSSCNLDIISHAIKNEEPMIKPSLTTSIVGFISGIFVAICPVCYLLPLLISLGVASFLTPLAIYGQWFVFALMILSTYLFYRDSKLSNRYEPLFISGFALAVFIGGRLVSDGGITSPIAGLLLIIATIVNYKITKSICKTC